MNNTNYMLIIYIIINWIKLNWRNNVIFLYIYEIVERAILCSKILNKKTGKSIGQCEMQSNNIKQGEREMWTREARNAIRLR